MISKKTVALGAAGAMAGLLLAFSIAQAGEKNSPFAFNGLPVLQNLTGNHVAVLWSTNRDALSWVEYGEHGQFDHKVSETEYGLKMALQTVHRVPLNDLEPGKDYTYRICAKEIVQYQSYQVDFGESLTSPTYSFRTPAPEDTTVSFVVFNDIHNSSHLWKTLAQTANATPYDVLVLNGDILADPPSDAAAIGCLLTPAGDTLGGLRSLLFVRGNHETRNVWARHLPEYIELPGGNYYQAFTRGPVRVVALDTGEDKPDTSNEYFGLVDFDAYLKAEMDWFEAEIHSEAFTSAPFRVVFMHIPRPVEAVPAPGDPRGRFAELLQEGKTDLLVCGHTHTQEIVEAVPGVRDYPIFIGGGNKPEVATVIRIDAGETALDVRVVRADGGAIAARTISSRGR